MSSLYSSLDESSDEIRLIVLEPLAQTGLVRCHLHKVSLKDITNEFAALSKSTKITRRLTSNWARAAPLDISASQSQNLNHQHLATRSRFSWGDYATLSYVWGDESKRKDIVIDNVVVSVTENLEAALRQLASEGHFQESFKLWVDAICINQSDDVERASQVNKMREIYSGCWKVIAWLGIHDDTTKTALAFRCLRILASLSQATRDISKLPLPVGCFLALHELMKRKYWSRLWIIQEVIMGASSTVLRCGNEALDWETFCSGIAVLYHGENWSHKDHMLFYDLECAGLSGDRRWHTASLHLVHKDFRESSIFEEHGGKRMGFRRLLEMGIAGDCRDARDKVFGLVGMMDEKIKDKVIPAYSFGISTIFAAVARAFIEHDGNLEPLRHANPWGAQTPHWAPDWTWKGRFRWTRPESNFTCPLWDPSIPEPDPAAIYNAHGGLTARYEFLDDLQLKCEGFIFDKVAGLGAPEDGFFKWHGWRVEQCLTWKSAYGDDAATSRALIWALMGGRIAQGETLEERHMALTSLPSRFKAALPQFQQRGFTWLSTLEGYYFKWAGWRKAHAHFMLGQKKLDHYFTDILSDDFDETTYIEVYEASCRTVQERRFMLTANGYLGWAPDNPLDEGFRNQARVGDKVAIIFGCSTPLIIRPQKEKYVIVGEAYVEGFMNGEAIRLLESGKCRKDFFTFV